MTINEKCNQTISEKCFNSPWLTAAASEKDAGMYKKILRSGHNDPSSITLIISNNEMEDIIKIVKSFEDSGLLLKEVTESVQNEVKEQKGGFICM